MSIIILYYMITNFDTVGIYIYKDIHYKVWTIIGRQYNTLPIRCKKLFELMLF